MKKRILIIISLIMVLITLSACGGENYKFTPLPSGPAINDPIMGGNSGVAVRKGDYIYMINGTSFTSEDNKFGTPVKGAIYRLKLDENDNIIEGETRIMVPKIIYSSVIGGGLYIPDNSNKLYYMSPSVSKDKRGDTLFTYIDIFCVNLDGTDTKKIATVNYIDSFQFIDINSQMYFVYSASYFEDEGNYNKTMIVGLDGKEQEVARDYSKVLLGDDNYIYYTKAVKKAEGEITGDEDYNKVYRKAFLNGTEEELRLPGGENISEDRYNVDLIELKDSVLYYTKNIFAGASAKILHFAFKDGTEFQLNYAESFTKPYFLGFDGEEYRGTLFYSGSSMVLAKADTVEAPEIITSLSAEPQYLFINEDEISKAAMLYFMSSEKMYSVKVLDDEGNPQVSEKISLLDYDVTIDLERYYPKKIGNYIYYIGIAEEEYYSKYLYRCDISEDLPDDYEPTRLGMLSKADQELEKKAKESEE